MDLYNRWKEKQLRQNNYQRPGSAASATVKCAVGTSLDVSSHRIRATHQVAFAIIGLDFSSGDGLCILVCSSPPYKSKITNDPSFPPLSSSRWLISPTETCRECLSASLVLLGQTVDLLRKAILSNKRHILDLSRVFMTSEAVRIRCISALADQYRRFSLGRAIPQELPIPNPRPKLQIYEPPSEPPLSPVVSTPLGDDPDAQTIIWSASSVAGFPSEPPSPPLTPKTSSDDRSRQIHGPLELESEAARGPVNGVFSIFCPVAMALQVDLKRVPLGPRKSCECGFRWCIPELSEGIESIRLKEGFRLTRRFLAKSHCSQRLGNDSSSSPDTQPSSHGYGCVLCTSTGRTETYSSVENLRVHIDATHNKWQMLHDPDMT